MADSISAKATALPASAGESAGGAGGTPLDRLSSFRVVYVSIFVFVLLYVVSVELAGALLQRHFEIRVAEAVRVNPMDGPVIPQIQRRVRQLLRTSPWIQLGEVRVSVHVFGADGVTPLYVEGRTIPPPPDTDPIASLREAVLLLPARTSVVVSVPHTGVLAIAILILYGAVLVTGLFFHSRRLARREAELLTRAISGRDVSAERAREIERELAEVRQRLREVEPAERAHAQEISDLESERQGLRRKLAELAEREAELRGTANRAVELEQERQALEELLEEATEDLGHKESEIASLQDRLKNAARATPKGGRARGTDQLARRLRTLYKNVEIDDRAVQDMMALGDETLKLRAEEGIKRLSDETDAAAVRRKVGGLPPQLSIFELGFAGKGRIYYTRGRKARFRVLVVGAKNTQKTDLEYLSRLSP